MAGAKSGCRSTSVVGEQNGKGSSTSGGLSGFISGSYDVAMLFYEMQF